MLTNRSLWSGRMHPFLAPDADGSGDASADDTVVKAEIKSTGEKGDDKEALQRVAAQRDAVRDELKTTRQQLETLLSEKTEREENERKAAEEAAEKRGEFEKLAQKREAERNEAKNEAAALKAENDQLRAAIAGVLDAEWKALPDEVRDAFLGDDEDPVQKLAFLPKGKVLAAKLTDKTEIPRGNGPNPKPGGNGVRPDDEAARLANARRYF